MKQDDFFLSRALELAQQNVMSDEGGPFGALIVRQGKIISEGRNQVIVSHDPTAHAEIMAIRSASRTLGTPHLSGCILYTSSEPCPMCLAAAYWARVEEIVFANARSDAASIGFCDQNLYDELCRPLPERSIPIRQYRLNGSLQPMLDWFANPKHRAY